MNNKGKVVSFERNGDFYCKMGLKLLGGQRLLEAAKIFRKAVELEPDNCEYHFNLAGVMAEMGNLKESVSILENAITNLTPLMSECYFALGCNYFDLGTFQKSRDNFEKYCQVSPNGAFLAEAVEAIRFIDINILRKNQVSQARIRKMADKGKELLDKCEFSKAVKVLKDVIRMDPDSTIPRNNLALAYYLQGDVGNAINITREVLRLDSGNPYANSNLTLFYKTIESKDLYLRQLKYLRDARFESIEEVLNAIDILSRLGEDSAIRYILERWVKKHDEIITWHFLSVSFHNLGKFSKAVDTWNYIKSKLPHMSIFTDCFVMETQRARENASTSSTINYDVKLYTDYMARIEELIKALLEMEKKEFAKLWSNNDYVRDIVRYFIYKLENRKKLKLIDMLASVGDEESIRLLNTYAEGSGRKDEVSSKCAEIVMRNKVAGDATINIVELSSKYKERAKRR